MSMAYEKTGMNEETAARDAADIKRNIFMGIVYRTVALALIAAFIVIYFPASEFFYPAIYAAIVLYVGLVVSLLIAGKMSRPLTYAAVVLATTVFLAVASPTLFRGATGLDMAILLTGIIGAAHFLSRAYSEFTGVVTRAFLIAAIGILYYAAVTAVDMPLLSELALLVLIAFVSTAVYSVLGILKRHSNERIAYVGELFARIESPAIVSVVVAVIMAYGLLIRQSLTDMGAFGLAVLEWAALSGAVLFIFIKIQSTLLADSAKRVLDVRGKDGVYSDKVEMEKAAMDVRAFIDDGKKEGLILRLTTALVNNNVPENKARPVLSIIIDHENVKEPPAMFKWAVGNIEASNRKSRSKAVDAMMTAMASAVNGEGNHGANNRKKE